MTFVTPTACNYGDEKVHCYSEAASAIFDEDFGLSDAESSEEETEVELYAYLSEPVVESAAVDNITRSIEDTTARDGRERVFCGEFSVSIKDGKKWSHKLYIIATPKLQVQLQHLMPACLQLLY